MSFISSSDLAKFLAKSDLWFVSRFTGFPRFPGWSFRGKVEIKLLFVFRSFDICTEK